MPVKIVKARAISQNTGLFHSTAIRLSESWLKYGSARITNTSEKQNEINATITDSFRNCFITCLLSAPTDFLMPTSFARFSLRAVERFMKLIHATSRINMPMTPNIHTKRMRPDTAFPFTNSSYRCTLSSGCSTSSSCHSLICGVGRFLILSEAVFISVFSLSSTYNCPP